MKKLLFFVAAAAALLPAFYPLPAYALPGMNPPPPPPPASTPNMMPRMICTNGLASQRDTCLASGPFGIDTITGAVRTAVCWSFYYIRLPFCDCVPPVNAAWCADKCEYEYKSCMADADEEYVYCLAAKQSYCNERYAGDICVCGESAVYCPDLPPVGAYDHCPKVPGENLQPAMAPPAPPPPGGAQPPILATTLAPKSAASPMMPSN